MKNVSLLLGYLAFSGIIGAIASFALMIFVPCEWFGWSNFEGACGYGLFFLAIPIGILIAAALCGIVWFRASRKPSDPQTACRSVQGPLFWTWLAMFVLRLVSTVLSLTEDDLWFVVLLPALTVAFFILASIAVVRRTGKDVAVVLLALVPIIGAFVVAFLLFEDELREKATVTRAIMARKSKKTE